MHIQPYLSFNGRCEEALHFYRDQLGGEITVLMRFKDSPEQPPEGSMPAVTPDKVMHSSIRIGDSELMATDGDCTGSLGFQGISLTLSVATEAEARQRFDALAGGGQVSMPLGRTFFSPSFGVVKDRFGVTWMVIVPAPMPD
ncbi:MAG TPA: VOC family protein [Candidatus Aquabacterium excrementipullorum]|nr:VOC family protein [Candidatus Aquabacterium excrementipullorum]